MGPPQATKSVSTDARKVKLPHSSVLSSPREPDTDAALSFPPVDSFHPLFPPNATVISGSYTSSSQSREGKKAVAQRKGKLNRLLRSAHHLADIACAVISSTRPKIMLRHTSPHNDDHDSFTPEVRPLHSAQASTRQLPFPRAE